MELFKRCQKLQYNNTKHKKDNKTSKRHHDWLKFRVTTLQKLELSFLIFMNLKTRCWLAAEYLKTLDKVRLLEPSR